MEFEENIGRIFSELTSMYGGIGLAFVSFAAATILPFSSEAALALAIVSGLPPPEAVIWASFGNCAACLLNYGLGYGSETFVHKKLDSSPLFHTLFERMQNTGWPILFLSFLPVIGDPITILSGFFKQRLLLFVSVVFTLRIVRYILLVYFFLKS
ncbi:MULTISPECIES: YqaA family protein [Leptospira]|uniref:SNARE-like domain protein n=2 Tax=Leptospira kirschneri TaxID=29507 RepID=A0A0E2BDM9_9LEPT|nr:MULTISPECIES: DedA family protein [Leptospira]EKO15271.1 SNARE-like domain protein [Leptospira kirschneri str. H1]EMK11082.1 SNARE-like domain protein [Leptospira kirschneri]EMK20228.1 SNARE-like domain protein [Leptospira kirschneri serovar Bulgarica str. Nikolaevo]KXZ27543.1 SNARE-like domain protein [Leptospira kirschneri]KXZ34171.1 SNARE-like domain protein [Leptospira sp. ZV016]